MLNEDQEKVYEIVRSFRKFNRRMYQLMREQADLLGITVVQLMTLRVLAKKPNISLAELADRLQLGNSTMSGVVERLVAAGLVVRERPPEDRRSLSMRLTAQGKEIEQATLGEDSILANRIYKLLDIPDEDLDHLLQTHEKILDRLREGEETKDGECTVSIGTKH